MASSQKKHAVESDSAGVRERLIDKAEELFAEHGFEATSIRDLATAAGCNIASVNYYFGGKENLYREVFRSHLVPITDMRVASINEVMTRTRGKLELEVLLRAFADAFIAPLKNEARASRFMKLMAREMINSHLPSDMFTNNVIIPTMTVMQKALLMACPQLDESKVPLIVFSIVGQLMHAVHTRPIFDQGKAVEMADFDLAKTIDHIVEFSAVGIRAYCREASE
ncbi:MAG: CerR family C-terminal domain-containing protein [Sedimentisphaerales bacterium]|nr:CerR family C-terminal domain-containing protein [Sedimentisphaerales bacterium]